MDSQYPVYSRKEELKDYTTKEILEELKHRPDIDIRTMDVVFTGVKSCGVEDIDCKECSYACKE